MLPHAYPFRFVERRPDGRLVVAISAAAGASRGAPLPAVLAIEILAQAALAGLAPEGEAGEGKGTGLGLLAGVDEARFHQPLRPGDQVTAMVETEGRFGRLVKAAGRLEREGEVVAEARLLLALGD